MKIKTAELEGGALDWAVAKCECGDHLEFVLAHSKQRNRYSTDWAQGGPIIERELMTVGVYDVAQDLTSGLWSAEMFKGTSMRASAQGFGPTPLIAAMRCFVASELGDEVEVPDGLH